MIDSTQLRSVLGQFATGVTVITTRLENGENYGFTANSFTSVSLDPALVLFCLDKKSDGCQFFKDSKCFAINILSAEQVDVSNRFANSALTQVQRFDSLSFQPATTGSPVLANTLGWLDCELQNYVDGGDHWIFMGKVVDLKRSENNNPLLYFGGYRFLKK